MATLDRNFKELSKNDHTDHGLSDFGWYEDGRLKWPDLLNHRRVVILAEAGAGKSTEIDQQHKALIAKGEYSFLTTVHTVAQEGLEDALDAAELKRFQEWKASDKEAWIFIDSVDEAKHANVRFDQALNKIAKGILDCEGRVHIVLTGRYTDWDFKDDELAIKKSLPLPSPLMSATTVLMAAEENEDGEITDDITDTDTPDDPKKDLLVVTMSAMDAGQVKAFFESQGISNFEDLIKAVGNKNLWRFARRPLDCDWLAEFWEANHRLGSLQEMLKLSLAKRLIEPDPHRQRTDILPEDKAMNGLQRIGAALTFGRGRNIRLERTEIARLTGANDVEIAKVLPEWQPAERLKLLTKAVFDLATFGRTRITNDNDANVSSYLAAIWLHNCGCSIKTLINLFFTETYGQKVVRPGMARTAAWLSLWDNRIAKEIVSVDPTALLHGGDPGSLTLRDKETILKSLCINLTESHPIMRLDRDAIKWFVSSELVPLMLTLWEQYKTSEKVRELFLKMIWLGDLPNCEKIIDEGLTYNDRYTSIYAGRALLQTATEERKKLYAEYITNECNTHGPMVWDAIESLFPTLLSPKDLLKIIQELVPLRKSGSLDLDWNTQFLSSQLDNIADVEFLLSGCLDRYRSPTKRNGPHSVAEDEIIPLTIALVYRLLELLPNNRITDLVIDAAIILRRQKMTGQRYTKTNYKHLLTLTPERRRTIFWTIAEKVKTNEPQAIKDGKLDYWSIEQHGLSPNLTFADIDWLVTDLHSKRDILDQTLCASTLLTIWNQNNRPDDLISRLKAEAQKSKVLEGMIELWTAPREPSEAELLHQREMEKIDKEQRETREKNDKSWTDFISKVSSEKYLFDKLDIFEDGKVDINLLNLWRLITKRNGSGWSVQDTKVLEPVFDQSALDRINNAFIQYWRSVKAVLHCQDIAEHTSTLFARDAIALLGISLESKRSSDWLASLSPEDVKKAAIFATKKFNGYPEWLPELIRAFPEIVKEVFLEAINGEIEKKPSLNFVEDLSRSDDFLRLLLAKDLLEILQENSALTKRQLQSVLSIVRIDTSLNTEGLDLCLSRFSTETDPELRAEYLNSVFHLEPTQGLIALREALQRADPAEAKSLCLALLPSLFGDRFSTNPINMNDISTKDLHELVLISFGVIKISEDIKRPGRVAYSPTMRDDSESARGHLLKALIDRKGEEAYRYLLSLAEVADFEISPSRIKEICREKAINESNISIWTTDQVIAFEKTKLTSPSTPKDLLELCLDHLEDIEHDAIHSDFGQGKNLSIIPDEEGVQKWVASQLNAYDDSYSVERESHSADENEPDLRIRSKTTSSYVPIEVKITGSAKVTGTWSVADLEEALQTQLCGKYLRDKECKHGILLLVNQKNRSKGWEYEGKFINLSELVAHLKDMASQITKDSGYTIFPHIAVIDVGSEYVALTTSRNKKDITDQENTD